MLRIVGGAARTGKSIIAQRLLVETQTPYLSLDILRCGLMNGIPSLGFDPDASTMENAEKLWPLARALALNMDETGVDYIIEGDAILPKQVHELRQAHQLNLSRVFPRLYKRSAGAEVI